MNSNDTLAKIPVVSQPRLANGLIWKRKAFQIGFISVLVLLPVLGIFRIDVSSGFVVLGREIWFSDFAIVFGFWLTIASSFIMLYSFVGTAFCGWACPQNSFSSLADKFTSKFLGKRAVIDWEEGSTSKIAHHKNRLINWVWLFVSILGISMLVSLIPLLYFVPVQEVWAFATFQDNSANAYSVRWIYFVFVFIAFVNYSVVRQYVCRYMCIYRMWQYLFKTRQTLHIDYDESRSKDCEKCNYCATQCMVEIDPTKTNMFDSCTNCGACISACNSMHAKKNEPGLLSFKLGERRNKFSSNAMIRLASFKERLGWVSPVWILAVSIFTWGLINYDDFHMAIYRADVQQDSYISEYKINLASKRYAGGVINLSVEGMDDQLYQLSDNKVYFDSVGRNDVFLKFNADLEPGMYTVLVKANSSTGWENVTRVNHFVTRGENVQR